MFHLQEFRQSGERVITTLYRTITSRIQPGVVLLFIAPFFGELLSAHQTLFQFVNPITFLMTALPYGFGAILCRELRIRWNTDWVGFLLLAIAYGVYEEAIVVRSFFNPQWSELGHLQEYFAFGLNWTYSFVLVHFHVVISIWCSVQFCELVFPHNRDERWVSGWKLVLCFLGLLLWLPVGWFMTDFVPSGALFFGFVLLFITLILLAKFHPAIDSLSKNEHRIRSSSAWPYSLIGAINVISTFSLVFFLPEQGVFPPLWIIMGALVLINGGSLLLLLRLTDSFRDWTDQHRWALLTGFLSFFLFISIVKAFEGTVGNGIVALIFLFGLIRLRKHIVSMESRTGASSHNPAE